MNIPSLIRTISDYPKAGVQFRDVTTLLKNADGFQYVIDTLAARYAGAAIASLVGIEARGFIIGAALAYRLRTGFVPLRKSGKLPAKTLFCDYSLEYGQDRLEIHEDALNRGDRVLLVDDLLATGGTAEAACCLLNRLEVQLIECAFLVELSNLGGRQKLEAAGQQVFSLCEFSG